MNWTDPFLISLAVLLLCMFLALIRVLLGPTAPDRVVALDTINTMVVAAMLVFGAAYREIIYIDVAIVYAVLSFITTLYVAKYLEGGSL
ncbi:MAG TPA: cation:proton antiporter [Thermoplasmatales archaeon]|nr:cation:proton antiporter [Candidatus Thermoplasmatota archaeon]MDD5778968.1 cation:proton antiporter [Candidatus Thermoplasmatota archaeon]HDS59873.1 cation:proton antiporter [Thermoplasmatales archaeon]